MTIIVTAYIESITEDRRKDSRFKMFAKEQHKKDKEITSFIESLKATGTFRYPFIDPESINNLTIKKIENYKLAMKEKSLKKTKLESRPYRIIIDPMNVCNLGCPLCPTGLKKSERKNYTVQATVQSVQSVPRAQRAKQNRTMSYTILCF